MNTNFRRKLEMATRVREFCRAHPSDDPAYVSALAQLEDHLTRAEAVAARQYQGIAQAKAARRRRRELRKDLHFQILHYLCAVADLAAKTQPALAECIRLPSPSLSHRDFLTAAKTMLAAARPHKDLLVSKGMSDSLLDDLDRMVVDLEAASEASRTARRDHIGARVDFDVLSGELLKDVRLLAGIYRYRFGTDQELMAEWNAVRKVPGLPQLKLIPASEPPKPTQDGTGSPAPGGSSQAA